MEIPENLDPRLRRAVDDLKGRRRRGDRAKGRGAKGEGAKGEGARGEGEGTLGNCGEERLGSHAKHGIVRSNDEKGRGSR